tara:strand:- start:148 stop:1137 length:990 start_codon:yes stop_codon:yes gene_type:complete
VEYLKELPLLKMANWFDIGTHLFALLPIAVSIHYREYLILVFMILATAVSTIYHADESNTEFHYLDHFFSSGLISLTFLLYLEHAYKIAAVVMVCLAGFAVVEYINDVNIITWFVGVIALGSVAMFIYEKQFKKNKDSRFDYKEIYFIGFFFTQILAIFFFLWDKEPYSHSFWHLFAYVSLGSVLAHCGSLKSDTPKTEEDRKIDRYLFYWLGSIPSRFYIAYVLMDWGSTTDENTLPIALTFLLLAGSMVANRKSEHARNKALAYSIIAGILFFGEKLELAGGILLADTALSAIDWMRKNVWVSSVSSVKKVYKEDAMNEIELANLVF